MVLNALEVDPKRRWKGNWRWFSGKKRIIPCLDYVFRKLIFFIDELLECCSSKEEMKKNGITFDKFACLAKCHCDVVVKRGNEITLQEFIKDVESVTSRSDQFMVISFSRKTLGQTGDGHFSPIGAYNTESKMVLVLDTARYKYPSYWCPIDVLLESMKPIDKETGRPRGYFLLSYDAEHPPVSLCKVQAMQKPSNENEQSADEAANTTTLNWSTLAKSFCKRIPENMWLEKPRTLEHVVQLVLRNVPPEHTVILANQSFASTRATTPERASEYIDQLLQDTAQSALYPIVFDALYPNKSSKWLDHHAAFATLFVLGSPRMLYTSLPRELQDTLDKYRKEEYMSDIVQREVKRISEEVSELTKSFCTCGPGWNETAPKDCA